MIKKLISKIKKYYEDNKYDIWDLFDHLFNW